MDQCTMAVPDILLTPYVLHDIVSSDRIDHFELAIDILEELLTFGDVFLVRIPGGRKLLRAMKLKYVLELIREQTHFTRTKVEKYFPSKQGKQDNLYKNFLNILMKDRDVQSTFFERDYATEFGTEYLQSMKCMSENLLLKIVPISEIVKQVRTEQYNGIARLDCLLDRLDVLGVNGSICVQDIESVLSLSVSKSNLVQSAVTDLEESFQQCLDISSGNKKSSLPRNKRPTSVKIAKSLFNVINDKKKEEENGENNESYREKLSANKMQVSSCSTHFPGFKVEMFYTSVKEKVKKQADHYSTIRHSSKINLPVLNKTDMFERLPDSHIESRLKHNHQSTKPKQEKTLEQKRNSSSKKSRYYDDTVIPSSVDGSPISLELGMFGDDTSYHDNEVQYIPDFSKFLKQLDLFEVYKHEVKESVKSRPVELRGNASCCGKDNSNTAKDQKILML